MKIPKENENMIKRKKEFTLNSISRIHAKLAFEGKTILDFDEYLLALAMIPLSFEEQANMRGLKGMEELMALIATYLESFPVKEEYK